MNAESLESIKNNGGNLCEPIGTYLSRPSFLEEVHSHKSLNEILELIAMANKTQKTKDTGVSSEGDQATCGKSNLRESSLTKSGE